MSPDELIMRCELNPRFGSELFKTKNANRRVDTGYDREWRGWMEEMTRTTYRLVDANAHPDPYFFRLRSHPLNEFVLSERFDQRHHFIRLCDEIGCLGEEDHLCPSLRSIRNDPRDSL